MLIRNIALIGTICGALAACGNTIGEQALSGGVIGAGTAAVVSGSLLQGAAVGAGASVLACQTKVVNCR